MRATFFLKGRMARLSRPPTAMVAKETHTLRNAAKQTKITTDAVARNHVVTPLNSLP